MTLKMLFLVMLVIFVGSVYPAHAQTAGELLREARIALAGQRLDEALALANKAAERDPKDAAVFRLRGQIHESSGKNRQALDDFSRALSLDPKDAETYHARGCVHFKLGSMKDSVRDFDKYIEMQPDRKASHWQRGISYYYAGQFDDGRQQFEGYQTFDSNDVENAVWRYMCMARKDGIAQARKDMLKIGPDKRVPMREVYEMFSGRLKPEEVLAAAVAGNPAAAQRNRQLFYAHLYVGIHYDIEGNPKKALEHLNRAADEHRIGHYMWDVARVHRDLLKRQLENK